MPRTRRTPYRRGLAPAGTLAGPPAGLLVSLLVGLLVSLLVGGCTSGAVEQATGPASDQPPPTGAPPAGSAATLPPLAAALVGLPDATGTDVFAVWICAVPTDTTDPTWVGRSLRLPLTADDVVDRAGSGLAAYFTTLSHGQYTVELRAGGTILLGSEESSEDCVEHAIDATSDPDAGAVLAVADAEHVAGLPGGWGTAGDRATCGDDCQVAASRRAAYVGASDFHPDWGPVPALDLLEHEIGHTLGLPHSGSGADGEAEYASALDVMSNSAARRDVDPTILDAPDTIGVDRLALGWLPAKAVVAVAGELGATDDVVLSPSAGTEGVRLLVLPVGDGEIVTVELLVPAGLDAQLPEAGVAVHEVATVHDSITDRRQVTLGSPPFTDLAGAGDVVRTGPWSIEVISLDTTAAVPTARVHVVRLAAEVTQG